MTSKRFPENFSGTYNLIYAFSLAVCCLIWLALFGTFKWATHTYTYTYTCTYTHTFCEGLRGNGNGNGKWKVNCRHMCVYIANNLTSAFVFVFAGTKLNSSCQPREHLTSSGCWTRWGISPARPWPVTIRLERAPGPGMYAGLWWWRGTEEVPHAPLAT